MGKPKAGTNIFAIIFKSLMLYIKNFLPLTRVTLFPVFGQLIGLILIFYPTYLYREQFLVKLSAQNLQQNLVFVLLGLILIVVPGFAIFMKAFWDYMIITASLNTMVSDIVKNGNLGNSNNHNNSVKLRTREYIILLFVLTLFWLLLLFLPYLVCIPVAIFSFTLVMPVFSLMMLIYGIFTVVLSVNHSLIFQIFSFESKSTIEIIKKSWYLIKGNFWRTCFMGIILLAITWWFVPNFFSSIFEKSSLLGYSVLPFKAYVNLFSQNPIFVEFLTKAKLTTYTLSENLALITVGIVISSMMLPLGSICFTLLYFDILERKNTKVSKS